LRCPITRFIGQGYGVVAKGHPRCVGNLTGLTAGSAIQYDRANKGACPSEAQEDLSGLTSTTKQPARADKGGCPSEARGDQSGLGTVLINASQGFEDILKEVWNFHIGGYQVCEKWFKDCRGRKFSAEEILHYQRSL